MGVEEESGGGEGGEEKVSSPEVAGGEHPVVRCPVCRHPLVPVVYLGRAMFFCECVNDRREKRKRKETAK